MRRALPILLAVAAVLVPSAVAQADSTNLPGGTALSVEITSPADEAWWRPAPPRSAARPPSKPDRRSRTATIVYVLDISGSANDPASVDCNGVLVNDTVLDVREGRGRGGERRRPPNAASPVLNSGLATFNNVGTALDVDPGRRYTAAHGAGPEHRQRGCPAHCVERDELRAGRQRRERGTRRTGRRRRHETVVFFSDGSRHRRRHPAGDSPAGTDVRAFAIGAGTCGTGALSLNAGRRARRDPAVAARRSRTSPCSTT